MTTATAPRETFLLPRPDSTDFYPVCVVVYRDNGTGEIVTREHQTTSDEFTEEWERDNGVTLLLVIEGEGDFSNKSVWVAP